MHDANNILYLLENILRSLGWGIKRVCKGNPRKNMIGDAYAVFTSEVRYFFSREILVSIFKKLVNFSTAKQSGQVQVGV